MKIREMTPQEYLEYIGKDVERITAKLWLKRSLASHLSIEFPKMTKDELEDAVDLYFENRGE